jgi:serine/threonine protein kinase
MIGAGGMGEVYRARDARLGRDIAIKILPAELVDDPERLGRFEHEARVIAALNHPNICTVHDVGKQSGTFFLVMELIEGRPLRELIPGNGLPLERLLAIAIPLADAIAAAHDRGIMHRDLKPENVMVTSDGRVKVLDFGLAKLQPSEMLAAEVPTVSAPQLTEQGRVLGTTGYMSPEQAEGRSVDHRTDIFSFGVILYELATGQRPFIGESSDALLASILRDTPPSLTELKQEVSRAFARIVRRSLAKDPNRRYQSALDLRNELEEIRNELVVGERPQRMQGQGRPLSMRRVIELARAAIGLAAVAGILYFMSSRPAEPPPHNVRPFATADNVESTPAWSPDGRTLAYAAESEGYYQIFTRPVDGSIPTSVPLTRLEADCVLPVWDSTGARIFFLLSRRPRHGEIWVVSSAGGAPTFVVDDAESFALAPDDSIAFLRRRTDRLELWRKDTLDVRRVGAAQQGLTVEGSSLAFSPDGHWLGMGLGMGFMLVPHPFDSAALQKSRTVTFDQGASDVLFHYAFAWMPDSRRVVFSGRENGNSDPQLWVGDTVLQTAKRLGVSPQWELMPAVSRDGTRVAFVATPMDWDIYEIGLMSRGLRALITGTRYEGWPSWVPRGNALVFSTMRTGRFEIWKHDLDDGSDDVIVTPDLFLDGPSDFLVESSVSPNGQRLAYTRIIAGDPLIYFQAINGKQPVRLTNAGARAAREDYPAWSPNSDWVVFRSRPRILMAPAIGLAAPILLADDAIPTVPPAAGPKWVGDQIIYQSDEGLRRVRQSGGPSEILSREQPLVWDLAPDGTILAILEGKRRMMRLVRIDRRSGVVIEEFPDLGQVPVTPDPLGYADTIRSLRVSPDGKRLALGYLKARSDIWIRDGMR